MRTLLFSMLSVLMIFNSSLSLAEDRSPLSIGALFSLSGWGAQGGQSELNGALLAVEDLNAAGGVGGRPLKLLIEDNRSDLKTSATGFRKLVAIHKVPAVLGPNWTEFVDVVAPIAVAERVPVITPSGYKESLIRPDPWVFVLWPPPSSTTQLLADAMSAQGLKKVSAIISDNAYYNNLFATLRPQLQARGIQVADEVSFAPGVMDYRSAIVRVERNKSEAVIAFLLESGELAAFLRQRKERNFKEPLFGANTIPFDPIVLKDLSLANGITYFDYVPLGGEKFLQRYEARFKSPAGPGSAKAYDGVFLIANAIQKCGPKRSQIRECLTKATLHGLSGTIEFDRGGVIKDTTANAKLLSVRDGKIVRAD